MTDFHAATGGGASAPLPGASDQYPFRAPRHGDLVACPYCDADNTDHRFIACAYCGDEGVIFASEVTQ